MLKARPSGLNQLYPAKLHKPCILRCPGSTQNTQPQNWNFPPPDVDPDQACIDDIHTACGGQASQHMIDSCCPAPTGLGERMACGTCQEDFFNSNNPNFPPSNIDPDQACIDGMHNACGGQASQHMIDSCCPRPNGIAAGIACGTCQEDFF